MRKYLLAMASLWILFIIGCKKDDLPSANYEMYSVQDLTATGIDNAVNLTWNVSEESSATGYSISWGSEGASIVVTDKNAVIENLENGTEYTFSVQVLYGDKGRSAVTTIKAKPISSKYEVLNFKVLGGDKKALVTWEKPLSTEILGYTLIMNPGNNQTNIDVEATNFLADGLTNDVEYTFTLVTRYPKGNSEGLTQTVTPGDVTPLNISNTFIFKEDAIVFEYNQLYFLGTIKNVLWNFGDGQTSTETSPSHTYTQIGKYKAELTVTYADNSSEKVSIDIYISGYKWKTLVNQDGERGEIKASSPAIASDGTVYISLSTNGDVYAFSPNGTVKWRFDAPTKGAYGGGPMIGSDGTVYAAAQDGNLYAINPLNGTQKWKFSTGNDIRCFPALATDGTIYVATRNSPRKLYAVTPSGTEKWNLELDDIASAIAVGANGDIYCGTGKTLYAVNKNGQILWSKPAGITEMGGIALKGNTIYAGAKAGEGLYAFTTAGNLLWNFPVSVDVYSPAIANDGTIYVSSKKINAEGGGVVFAINPNGTQKWKFAASGGGFNFGSPTIDENGVIYIASERGGADFSAIYAINPDGTQKWVLNRGSSGQMFSTPAISKDGILYIGDIGDASNYGSLFAIPIFASHADPATTWYTRGGNNLRTGR